MYAKECGLLSIEIDYIVIIIQIDSSLKIYYNKSKTTLTRAITLKTISKVSDMMVVKPFT